MTNFRWLTEVWLRLRRRLLGTRAQENGKSPVTNFRWLTKVWLCLRRRLLGTRAHENGKSPVTNFRWLTEVWLRLRRRLLGTRAQENQKCPFSKISWYLWTRPLSQVASLCNHVYKSNNLLTYGSACVSCWARKSYIRTSYWSVERLDRLKSCKDFFHSKVAVSVKSVDHFWRKRWTDSAW